MIDPRKQAYLEAMGFDVWVARSSPATRDRLALAPGQGSTLLVCARAGDRETALAADIARAVGDDPTWGWPDPAGLPDAPTLEQAIEKRINMRRGTLERPGEPPLKKLPDSDAVRDAAGRGP